MKSSGRSKRGIALGLLLILVGILFNEKVLTIIFSSDGVITIFAYKAFIWCFDILCVLAGILILKYEKRVSELIPNLTPREALIYCIFSVLVICGFGEVGLRLRGDKPFETNDPNITVTPGGKLFTKNPTLGYTHLPGKFKVTLNNASHSFWVTNLDNTLRITHPLDTYNSGKTAVHKREIWVFGCSITYGWAVDDNQTYLWLLQKEFPDYEIVNFGACGYGTIHSLIQFQEALKQRGRPELALLAYGSFQDTRNTFSRQRRKLAAAWNRLGPIVQPYARIDHDGHLHYYMAKVIYTEFPLMRYSAFVNWIVSSYDNIENYFCRSHEVSRALVKELSSLCANNNVKFAVAGINKEPLTVNMLEYCGKEGIPAGNISPAEWDRTTTYYPYDLHPSPLGHKILAENLAAIIRNMGIK